MKRQRSLLILAAAAVVAVALVWWDQRRPTTDEASLQRQHLLPGFERARANEIEVEKHHDGATVKLRHEASGWWIAGSRRLRADDTAVDSLLGVLEYGQVERRIEHVDAALRKKLGVDVPRFIVRVEGHTLRIGGDDPSRGVYVERDDERDVLVAERRLIETAGIDPRLWESMRLTLTTPSDARKIATDGWTLERAAGWRVTRPVKTRASDAKVDALVQTLERARAIDAGIGTGSAPDPRGTVTLALDGVEQARVVGMCTADDPTFTAVMRADGAGLCFRPTDLNLLYTPATTYYERRLFPLRLDDVVAADLGPLSLRREAGVWRIIAPLAAAGPARDEAVRALLEPLLAAEARSFSAAAPAAGATRVRLASHDDDISATVDGALARRAGDDVSLALAAPIDLRLDTTRLRVAADLGTTPF